MVADEHLLDAMTSWTAVYAVATVLLVLATAGLVAVGFYAAQWAKRTFGQQADEAQSKREPHVAIWLGPPPGNYTWQTENQLAVFIRWYNLIQGRPAGRVAALPQMQHRLVCWVQNLGEGPAVRVRVPYRLTIINIAEDKQSTGSDTFDGVFEIFHVQATWLIASGAHLDVTYYPEWKVELLLDKVEVTGLQGVKFDLKRVLAETSTVGAIQTRNNDQIWDILLQSQPPVSQDQPPS